MDLNSSAARGAGEGGYSPPIGPRKKRKKKEKKHFQRTYTVC